VQRDEKQVMGKCASAGDALMVQIRLLRDYKRFEFIVHLLRVFFDLCKRQACSYCGHRDAVYFSIQRRLVTVHQYIVELIYQKSTNTAYEERLADGMVYRMLVKINGADFKDRDRIIVGVYFRIRKAPYVGRYLFGATLELKLKGLAGAEAGYHIIIPEHQELPLGQQFL
jgi:hypothetical protein